MAGKKKNPNAQYAFIGLIVALLACVSTGLVGAAKALISMGMFTFENTDTLNLALQISIGVVVLGIAAYAILSPDSIRRFFTGRQARYGSNSLILILAVLGILFVANYMVFNNPQSWDLTEDKSNTLSDETLQILATLPEKVTATAFFTSNSDRSGADELLQKFKSNSQNKFDYTFVDPDTNPVAAREAGVTGDGKILLQMGETKEIAAYADEQELTRTMIRLISPEPRTVYFLQGHGEATIDDAGGGENVIAYSVARSTLEAKNYTVESLNLLATNSIPDDALAVIIAGPQKPVSQSEVNKLKEYVDAGGSLIVMENPTVLTEFGDESDPLASYLERDWGITLNNDMIFDQTSQDVLNAISTDADSHPVTTGMTYVVIMPQARSLSVAETPAEGVTLTSLLRTSTQSWGETDLTSETSQYQFDEGVDFSAPLTMAAAAENFSTGGRVVVTGNSLFASDNFFDAYGNGNLFINSVDWAAEQEDLLNLPVRETTQRSFQPPSQWNFLLLVVMMVLVLPGLTVAAGVYSWFARRRRG